MYAEQLRNTVKNVCNLICYTNVTGSLVARKELGKYLTAKVLNQFCDNSLVNIYEFIDLT